MGYSACFPNLLGDVVSEQLVDLSLERDDALGHLEGHSKIKEGRYKRTKILESVIVVECNAFASRFPRDVRPWAETFLG